MTNPSNNLILETLLTKYSQFSAAALKHETSFYSIIPLLLTAAGGLFFLGSVQERAQIIGLGEPFIFIILLTWLGINHCVLNNYGLKLVELELRINKHLPNKEFSYYTKNVAAGRQTIIGYSFYCIIFTIAAAVLFFTSLYFLWSTMINWGLSIYGRLIGLLIPLIINFGILAYIYHTEIAFERKKKALVENNFLNRR